MENFRGFLSSRSNLFTPKSTRGRSDSKRLDVPRCLCGRLSGSSRPGCSHTSTWPFLPRFSPFTCCLPFIARMFYDIVTRLNETETPKTYAHGILFSERGFVAASHVFGSWCKTFRIYMYSTKCACI